MNEVLAFPKHASPPEACGSYNRWVATEVAEAICKGGDLRDQYNAAVKTLYKIESLKGHVPGYNPAHGFMTFGMNGRVTKIYVILEQVCRERAGELMPDPEASLFRVIYFEPNPVPVMRRQRNGHLQPVYLVKPGSRTTLRITPDRMVHEVEGYDGLDRLGYVAGSWLTA